MIDVSRIPATEPVQIIIGAGDQRWPGWIATDLLAYCDEQGRFHYHQWSPDQGPIYRSLRLDDRNQGDKLVFVSLIINAKKPD